MIPIALVWATVSLALDVPPLTGRIVDLAAFLPADVARTFAADLAAYEHRTGNQIALLTIPSLQGEPLEAFSHRVATTWKLGRIGVDNGVLLLIVRDERAIRLEVGYGLEGVLTDAASSRIIHREIVPRFRAGDYAGGIGAGLQAIMKAIEGLDGPATQGPSGDAERWDGLFLAVVVAAVIGGFIGSHVLLRGSVVGGLIAFVMAFPSGLGWAAVAAGLACVGAFVLAILFRIGGQFRGMRPDSVQRTPWLGDSTGDLHSRDVFMGGGGDFGGGGASGRW